MSDDRSRATPPQGAARDYTLLCLTSLMLVLLGLIQLRIGAWALFPAVVGVVALTLRLRLGPPLVLVAVLLVVVARWLGTTPLGLLSGVLAALLDWVTWGRWLPLRWPALYGRPQPSLFSDVVLAAGMLGFSAAYYRLQGLHVRLFPEDPRERLARPTGLSTLGRAKEASSELHRRPLAQVELGEVLWLLSGVPVCVGLALALWRWVQRQRPELDLEPEGWQVLVLVWVLGSATLIMAAVLRYLAQRRMTPDEAAVYLQDQAWRETRGEQRRLNRWLAWAWLQRGKKEKT